MDLLSRVVAFLRRPCSSSSDIGVSSSGFQAGGVRSRFFISLYGVFVMVLVEVDGLVINRIEDQLGNVAILLILFSLAGF